MQVEGSRVSINAHLTISMFVKMSKFFGMTVVGNGLYLKF